MPNLLINLSYGILLGLIGQLIRILVGMKKWYDDNNTTPPPAKPEPFDKIRFVISILTGMVAGALGAIALYGGDAATYDTKFAIGLIAIGYTGTDFIEGFIIKYLPKP